MDNKHTVWNSQQTLLRGLLAKSNCFNDAIQTCLYQHAMVHASEMSGINEVTFEDEVWRNLDEYTFRTMPTVKDETIAWGIWHITRIEDITINILVAGEQQVFTDDDWAKKMNVTVSDTGNAMTNGEIITLSKNLNMQQLRNYRMAVGRKTREIIKGLQPADLKRKMEPARLQRILDEGAVLDVDGSRWLVDFWGKKTVAGILLMPVTRHHLVHLNEAMRIKKKCLIKGQTIQDEKRSVIGGKE